MEAQRAQFSMPLNVVTVFLWLFTITHRLTAPPHKASILLENHLTHTHTQLPAPPSAVVSAETKCRHGS